MGGLIGRSVYKYTVCPCCITSCLQPTQPTAMAFNGTWKVDRNDNYDKFMEQMGESCSLSVRNTLQSFIQSHQA